MQAPQLRGAHYCVPPARSSAMRPSLWRAEHEGAQHRQQDVGVDVALVRLGEAEPLVSFQCDYQMGMISILDSYRRLAQAKTAMDRCLDKLARSAPEGHLVDSAPVPVVAAAETSTRTP